MLIQELRRYIAYLAPILLVMCMLSLVLVTGSVVSMAVDAHAMRANQVQESANLIAGLFSRIDSIRWQADTLNTTIIATNKTVAAAITQARVQEKHAREDQKADLKETSTAVVKAAEQTATTQTKALEQIIAAKPAVVNVETPKPLAAAAPTIVVQPSPVQAPHAPVIPVKKRDGPWHWLRRLWPFGRHDGG